MATYSTPELDVARASSVDVGSDVDCLQTLTRKKPSFVDASPDAFPLQGLGDDLTKTTALSSRAIIPTDRAEIERLGRVRPVHFKSTWSEVGFILSVCMAQILVVRSPPSLPDGV